MNQYFRNRSAGPAPLEARVGLRLAARLNQSTAELPHDIGERLRFARERALEQARVARQPQAAQRATVVGGGRSAALALGGGPSWSWRLAALLPMALLVVGLVTIQTRNDDEMVFAAAEIDAALLADDLPPAAYADAGFAEFLRTPND